MTHHASMHAGKVIGLAGGEEQLPWDSRSLGLFTWAWFVDFCKVQKTLIDSSSREWGQTVVPHHTMLPRGIKQGVETHKLLLPLTKAKHV